MGTDDVEAGLAERTAPNAEGIERGIVLLDIKLPALWHGAQRLSCIERLETRLLKFRLKGLNGQEIHWRSI